MSDHNLFFTEDEDSEERDFSNTQFDYSEENEEAGEDFAEEYIKVSRKKIAIIKNIVAKQCEDVKKISEFLELILPSEEAEKIGIGQLAEENLLEAAALREEGKVLEGVFDGENMIGPDGKRYSVPANYASKSKLVEGDIMKLSILQNGTFIYKQICPAKRRRVAGILKRDGDDGYLVESDGKRWKILTASATYFKGDEGDEAIVLVPEAGESKWGALENVVKRYES